MPPQNHNQPQPTQPTNHQPPPTNQPPQASVEDGSLVRLLGAWLEASVGRELAAAPDEPEVCMCVCVCVRVCV